MADPFSNPIRLHAIADKFGTPTYLYSEEVLTAKYRSLMAALGDLPVRVHYAIKANASLRLLKIFQKLGAGFDVVSGGELARVLQTGASGGEVVFAGVGKTDAEIEFALKSEVKFLNIESAAELDVVENIATRLGLVAPVAFRLNPNVRAKTHAYIETGMLSTKFGMPAQEIFALWEKVQHSKNLRLCGIHCHIGSNVSDLTPLEEGYREALRVALELKAKGASIQTLDLGGGLGISYSGHYEALDLPAFGRMVANVVSGTKFELIFEPGKYLIAEAGALLTRVIYRKSNGSKRFVIVDAGMNDLIRPALYDSFHKIDVVASESSSLNLERVDVVGPVCESGCFLAKDRELPTTRRGDVLLVRDAGAYGMSMSSNYNSRPRPAEVLIEASGDLSLIRTRETFESLWQGESDS